jgi:hypothetical protein
MIDKTLRDPYFRFRLFGRKFSLAIHYWSVNFLDIRMLGLFYVKNIPMNNGRETWKSHRDATVFEWRYPQWVLRMIT